ncbi:tRNA pseudouridine(55) synthase TruB [bacterium]|nr:tRNA pseudouridine(55) synthase TruB [bacterium]
MCTSGLLNLDKPYGMSSFHAISAIKQRFGWKKIGHAGTLDPLATGILSVCVGKATRLIPFLTDYRKRYRALIRLGIETETQDREGEILRVYSGRRYPSMDDIEMVFDRFRGQTEQVPPMYSALRCKGRRLYEWARAGKEVPRSPRKITIYKLACLAYSYPFLYIDVICGKGTYIRTLAFDIGACLGTGAHIWALERVGVGWHKIEDTVSWKDVMSMDHRKIEENIVPIGDMLSFLPVLKLDAKGKEAMIHGRRFFIDKADIADKKYNFDTDYESSSEGLFPCNIEKSPYVDKIIDGESLNGGISVLRIKDQDGNFLGLGKIVPAEKGSSVDDLVCIQPSLVLATNLKCKGDR